MPIGNKFHRVIPRFDEILVSPLPLPETPAAFSLAALIFDRRGEERDQDPIFLGHIDDQPVSVSLRTLRHTVLALAGELRARGLAPGDTVCLVRLPNTSETPVAAMENVRLVPFAGTVTVPGEPDFVISSHTAPGTVFCCAAEAMLMGLEPEATRDLALVGRLDPAAVAPLDRLGVKHGFTHSGRGGFRAEEIS